MENFAIRVVGSRNVNSRQRTYIPVVRRNDGHLSQCRWRAFSIGRLDVFPTVLFEVDFAVPVEPDALCPEPGALLMVAGSGTEANFAA